MKQILVIDPANIFIQYVELVVARYGYSTTGVSSAREALDNLEKEEVNLVIAQEDLPDMTWPEFCQELKAGPGHPVCPVVVLSAGRGSVDAADCPELSVARVSTRPISMRDLITVIQKHLPYRNKRRQIRAPLALKSHIYDGDAFVPCQILNLSEGGAFVMRKDPFPVGTRTHLILPFQDVEEPMVVSGRVVYSVQTARGRHPRGMGIQFNELDLAVRERLQRYMEEHLAALVGR